MNDNLYLSTGILGSCEQCRSDYGIDDAAEFDRMVMDEELYDEGSFSYHDCELCGSDKGGDRYAAHDIDEHGDLVHYEICRACVMAEAYGD